MMLQVFISYKSEYREFARKVRDQIGTWGFQTWFDVEDIPKGSYFPDEIDKGLASSDILVGVMTKEAFESRPIKIEWDYFLYSGKPIFPLKYNDCQPPPRYIAIQHIDFMKDEGNGFAQLHEALSALARMSVPASPAPLPEPTLEKSVSTQITVEKDAKEITDVLISDEREAPASQPSPELMDDFVGGGMAVSEPIVTDLLRDFIQDNNDQERAAASVPPGLKAFMLSSLDVLGDQERAVLELRFGLKDGQGRTREDAARQLDVSPGRVRQTELKALNKLVQQLRQQQEDGSPLPVQSETAPVVSRAAGEESKASEPTIADLLNDFIRMSSERGQKVSALPQPLRSFMLSSLDILSERERDILERRFGLKDGEGKGRYEVSSDLGLAGERIRQIEMRALNHLAEHLREEQKPAPSDGVLPPPPPEAAPAKPVVAASLSDADYFKADVDQLASKKTEAPKPQPSTPGLAFSNAPGAAPMGSPMPAQAPPTDYTSAPAMVAAQRESNFRGGGIATRSRSSSLWSIFRRAERDEAELAHTNRERMLQKVSEFWVKGVLDHALQESGAFDLGLSAAPGAVLKHLDYGDYALPSSANIGRVFDDLNRELLILGAPGAGKTILLLELARDLIARAEEETQEPIPVIFNLSSWAAERKPFGEWLSDELRQKYQVPKKVAQNWVETEQLTLLLDGLDEVPEPYRNACVDAINTFRQRYTKTDLAVCSRIADYGLLTSKLDLRGAITLQPLSQAQIHTYIDRPELSSLRGLLETDTTVQAMAATPFLLNTMAYAYRDATPMGLKVPEGDDLVKARRTHLFDAYVEKRLNALPSQFIGQVGDRYTHAQARHYLAWLAGAMLRQTKTMFYISRLQPGWLKSPGLRWICSLASILVSGTVIGIAAGFGVGTYLGAAAGLGAGLIIGLSAALSILMAIFTGLRVRLALVAGVRAACILALGYLLQLPVWIYVVLFGLLLAYYQLIGKVRFKEEGEIETVERFHFAWIQSAGGILLGGIVAFALGGGNALLLIPAFMLLAGLTGTRREIPMDTAPNQEIQQTFQSANLVGLLIGVVFGLAFSAIIGFQYLVVWMIAAGVVVWFHYGGLAIVQHFILRLILYYSGDAPLNYVRFLDYAASVQILRKVGGGYIFVHRYLLEYFAELPLK